MGFYNRGGPTSIVTWEDDAGQTHPIDVVQMGGLFVAEVGVANNTSVQILPAATGASSSGNAAWRLHSWGISTAEGLAANSLLFAGISDSRGGIDGETRVYPAATTVAALGKPLDGLVTSSAVTVTQLTGGTVIMFVRYDPISLPKVF